MLGRKRRPLKSAFVRYEGDTPGSPYYVNDLLAANGLRYVWLNTGDLHRNRIALPEEEHSGRSSILKTVTMDDGVRYYRFERCYGRPENRTTGECYLRDSVDGFDSSQLITESNLKELCRTQGTCILYTHWTHFRSMAIQNATLERFYLLRDWRDAGKIWVTSLSRLLEWTRMRTFLKFRWKREGSRSVLEILGIDDPIFGWEKPDLEKLEGLWFVLPASELEVKVALNGEVLAADQIHRSGRDLRLRSKKEEKPVLAPCYQDETSAVRGETACRSAK